MRRPHASAQHGAPPRDRHVGREGKALIKRHVTRLAETDRCWHRPPHIELSVRVSMSCELCDPFVSYGYDARCGDEVEDRSGPSARGVRTPGPRHLRTPISPAKRQLISPAAMPHAPNLHVITISQHFWLRAGVGTTCLRVVPVVADRRVTRLTRQSRLATAARDRSSVVARPPPSPHRACTSATSRESELQSALRRGRPRQVEPAKPPARPRPDVSAHRLRLAAGTDDRARDGALRPTSRPNSRNHQQRTTTAALHTRRTPRPRNARDSAHTRRASRWCTGTPAAAAPPQTSDRLHTHTRQALPLRRAPGTKLSP